MIQEEGDERTFQLRSFPHIHREPCTGDLGATVKIDQPERLDQLPMRLGGKVNDGRRPPMCDGLVIFRRFPVRHRGIGQVRDLQHHGAEIGLHHLQFVIQGLDLIRHALHFRDHGGSIFLLRLHGGDLLGHGVLPALERLPLLHQCTPARIQLDGLVHVRRVLAFAADAGAHHIRLFSEKFDIQHGSLLSNE